MPNHRQFPVRALGNELSIFTSGCVVGAVVAYIALSGMLVPAHENTVPTGQVHVVPVAPVLIFDSDETLPPQIRVLPNEIEPPHPTLDRLSPGHESPPGPVYERF